MAAIRMAATKKAKKAPKEKKPKGPTIRDIAEECIMKGLDFAKTKDMVDSKVPGNNFGQNSFRWYRSKLKVSGANVPPLSKKDKAEQKKTLKGIKKGKKKAAPVDPEAPPAEEPEPEPEPETVD